MLGAIVPAAGASRRMGQPKALLHFHGVPFLESVLAALRAAGIERPVVVLGADAPAIRAAVDFGQARVVMTEAPDAGPIGSLRTALRLLQSEPVSGVLVWAVDRPHVQIATVERLIDAFNAGGSAIVLPVWNGRRGHPVIFARELFAELLAAPDDDGARAVVRRDPARIHTVMVDDPAVVENLNTPEDYRALVRREAPHPPDAPGST